MSEERAGYIRGLIKDIVAHPEHRDEIVAFVLENSGVDYARRRLDDYVQQAVKALDVLKESEEKAYLAELAHYTALRDR